MTYGKGYPMSINLAKLWINHETFIRKVFKWGKNFIFKSETKHQRIMNTFSVSIAEKNSILKHDDIRSITTPLKKIKRRS